MADEDEQLEASPPVEPGAEGGRETTTAGVVIPDGGGPPKSGDLRLADVFVLLFIVAVLAALILPAIRRARISGTAIACRDNLRRIGVALGLYQADYDELFPTSNNVVWKHYPAGWEANWLTRVGNTTYSVPLQTLAAHGYLNIGWRDNRDRVADSVCRCPYDRAARRQIRDPNSFNSCKRTHCAGGLTISYAHNHLLHVNHFPGLRNSSLVVHAPEKTMCLGEYDWHNHSSWFGLAGGIRPDNRWHSGGAFSYRYDNNAHCPTDRHGGIVNILFADLHVEGRNPFEWYPGMAFSRCNPADKVPPFTYYESFSKPMLFYWPLGYGL
ncbi:MAG: hypothetical protein ACYTAN_12655 [Planctomycetota bacterium]|jgi:prepilin-type processing-associated H-X9-DG protein